MSNELFVNQILAVQEHLVHAWNALDVDVLDSDAWPPTAINSSVGSVEYHIQAAIEIIQRGFIQEGDRE